MCPIWLISGVFAVRFVCAKGRMEVRLLTAVPNPSTCGVT